MMRSQSSTIPFLGGVGLLIISTLLAGAPLAAASNANHAAAPVAQESPAPLPSCPGLPGCALNLSVGPSPASMGQEVTASGAFQPCMGAQFSVQVDWGDGTIEVGAFHEGDPADDPVPYSFNHVYSSAGEYAVVALLLHQAAEGQDCAALAAESLTVEAAVGSITLEKSEANGAAPDDWTFQLEGSDGSSYVVGSGQTISDLPMGQYSITESGPQGWHLTSVSGEGCALEGQSVVASIVSGTESITCTLVNEVDSPAIVLEKYVSDDTATWYDADAPPGPYIIEYDPAFWTFVISNTGNVDLTTVVVTDTVLGEICTIDSLGAGTDQICTAISLAEEGQQENLGFASAEFGDYTVGDQDPCHYFGLGYIVPTLTPETPTPTPTAKPKGPGPAPAPAAPTPVPATPTPAVVTPTPTVLIEVLGVERLPETGIEASGAANVQWLTGLASALLTSAAVFGLLRRRK
ncbi:MAG: hypothetical protein GTO63_30835 [Anaerolineae bacterium]|nr:hypothetical protein [Anaerolineae bacterium]NIQ81935.1 hypothetical protein [Anaerolineae bacterium]